MRSLPFAPIPGDYYYSICSTGPEQSFVPPFYFTIYPIYQITLEYILMEKQTFGGLG